MKKFTCESFLGFKFVSDPTLSPSGKHTAFIVQTPDLESNGYNGAIHLLCNHTGKTTTLTTLGSVKSFSWVDDTTILFPAVRDPEIKKLIDKGEELTSYYTINIDGGEASLAFTVDVKAGKATPLKDGSYLIPAVYDNNRPSLEGLSQSERDEVLEELKANRHTVFEELPFWANNIGIVNRKRNRLYIYQDGTVTPITEPLFEVYGYKSNGEQILYTGAEYTDVKPLMSGLFVYNIAQKTTTCLIEPKTYSIKMTALNGNQAILALTDGSKYGMGENGDLYAIDLKTKELIKLVDHAHSGMGSSVNSDARLGAGNTAKVSDGKLYYLTTLINHSYINCLDLTTKECKTLTTAGSADSFDIVGDQLVFAAFKGNSIAELYKLEGGKEVKLTSYNDKLLSEYTLSVPQEMRYTGSDGVEIHGWVMPPVGYVKGNKYPAILHIHGGPRTVFSDIFHHEMQTWAAEGYFVFYCNPRGGDGKGNEFADIRAKYGTVDYVNLMEFTDQVLAAYADIDADRLGVTGGSYGGFMTNWIIGHTHRFKAACSQRCISNWTTFEGTTDIGYYFGKDQTGAGHTQDRDLQWEQSPLKYADKVKTPTLFIHSDQDYRCWMVECLQMFTALKMHGVESRVCLVKGENHELSRSGKPKNRIKRMEEIIAWMNSHLK